MGASKIPRKDGMDPIGNPLVSEIFNKIHFRKMQVAENNCDNCSTLLFADGKQMIIIFFCLPFSFLPLERPSMRCFALPLLLLISSIAFAVDGPVAAPKESEMQSIFNGKDLDGWDGDPRLWKVQDGVIHGETTVENKAAGNTFLIWKKGTTKDFELRLSFRCNATNNSGIQYRSKHISDVQGKNSWVVRGYQHELRNEVKFPNTSSFIYDEGGKRGRICLVGEKATWGTDGKKVESANLIDEAAFGKLMKLDDWNEVVIIGKGPNIQHYLNNQLVLDFTDKEPTLALNEGVLALQLHAGNPMWAEFKNIRIKEIK